MTAKEKIKAFNWFIGDMQECAQAISRLLKSVERHHIVTANMELLALARQDDRIASVCQKAKMIVPDGIGAVLLLKKIGLKSAQKIAGVELCPIVLKNAPKGTKAFLFGAKEGVADLALKNLAKSLTHIGFVGSEKGFGFNDSDTIRKINDSGADMLFVALGMPKQELWISENLPRLNTVKVAIGVGGSFDVWANTKKRAPRWMQKLGLEWAHRVFGEPLARLPRFAKTVVGFLRLYVSK